MNVYGIFEDTTLLFMGISSVSPYKWYAGVKYAPVTRKEIRSYIHNHPEIDFQVKCLYKCKTMKAARNAFDDIKEQLHPLFQNNHFQGH